MSPKRKGKRAKRRQRRARRSKILVFGVIGLVLFLVACCTVATHVVKKRATHDQRQESENAGRVQEEPSIDERSPLEFVESPYCLHGCPAHLQGSDNTILEREGWVLSNDPDTKFADWAAYRVTKNTIGKSKRRSWKADPDLPAEETLEPEDFKGAHAELGTDRGHQVPLASFSGTKQYQPLNYLSNLTPQRSQLNQQLWNLLEQAERALVLRGGAEELFVVTGPLFEKKMEELPGADEPHKIPSGYFKVIALKKSHSIATAAIIVSQDTPGKDSHCDHRVTIDEVEKRSGLDFFPALGVQRQARLESQPGELFGGLKCP